MTSLKDSDWFTKPLTTKSSRRSPRTSLVMRIVLAAWIVVVIAVHFSIDDWWVVVFIPFLTLDLWVAKNRVGREREAPSRAQRNVGQRVQGQHSETQSQVPRTLRVSPFQRLSLRVSSATTIAQ